MIGIDLQNRKPIYEQIVERFQTLIVNGVLEPDSQMPSVRSLAMELSINPNTIQKAYSALEQEGYIYPVKGRGNFVSGNKGLKQKKQEDVYQSLQQLVQTARELDIDCATFIARTQQYYAEAEMDEAGIENRAGRKEAGPENKEPENIRNGKTEERSEGV
jgi:GntR family transcriptional regulator